MAQALGKMILQNTAAALGPADGIGPSKYQRPAARVGGDLLALQILGQLQPRPQDPQAFKLRQDRRRGIERIAEAYKHSLRRVR